jgi:serpin B
MRPRVPFLVALLVAGLLGASAPAVPEGESPAANAAFALDLYRRVGTASGNVFFSPFSVSEALAIAWEGARGETARQMARVLHVSGRAEDVRAGFRALERRVASLGAGGNVELSVANSLWPQAGMPLRPGYLALLSDVFGASPSAVDYRHSPEAARREINRWVGEKTRDRIRDLLPPDSLRSDTRLVLANAIYFKGRWERPFDRKRTSDAPFHVREGRSVPAPFMHRTVLAGYLEVEDAQILCLPYEGGLFLAVLLPTATYGLPELEARLTAPLLGEWLSAAGRGRQAVEVVLPRFRMDSGFRLKAALASLGMTDAFDPARADFSGMTADPEGLCIDEGFHKAFVDVNEEGTEAAAATGVVAVPVSVPAPKPVVRADHPFDFLIGDEVTGEIFFLGRLADPAPEPRRQPKRHHPTSFRETQ